MNKSTFNPFSLILSLAIIFVPILALYAIRPLGLIHGTVMFFYTLPLVGISVLGILVACVIGMVGSSRNSYDTVGLAWAIGILSAILLVVAMFFQGAMNSSALYENNKYEGVKNLPQGGVVRLMPKEVADQIANNNFSSSTETLRNSHIVREEDGKLHWTYEQAPNGFFRSISKNTAGAVGVDATEVNGDTTNYDESFKVGPSMKYADSIRWRVYKKHYLAEVTEVFAIPIGKNEVIFAAPYVKYKGFIRKSPYFAGVMLVHADGKMEDLSPKEAAENDALAASGRLFPEKLARQIHDAYAFNGGIWNKWFTKKDVTTVSDPDENNTQPYLMAFGDDLKWVSVAEPASKEGAVKAVFMTDAVSGETEIWRVNKSQSFAGPKRALDAAAGRNYEGIVFGKGRGKFKAVEPRPVFFDNKLHYLISIVPATKTEVTKSVIVDADRNRVVAVFSHDTDKMATDKLLEALEAGKLPEVKEVPDSVSDLPEGATIEQQLEALIAEQKADATDDIKRAEKMEVLLDKLKSDDEHMRYYEIETDPAKGADEPVEAK